MISLRPTWQAPSSARMTSFTWAEPERLRRLAGLAFGLRTLLAIVAGAAQAQSNISPADHYAYGANAGWIDLRPSAADGVRVTESFCSGNAYAANFGWIDFGDGTPANGFAYANNSAADCGVNLAGDGSLTGFAYAANVGWISFERIHGQPRLNFLTGKFTGAIYAANVGWISLDTPVTDLAASAIAYPDSDGDGLADAWELKRFGNLTAANATTDFDGDGESDLAEHLADTLPKDPASRLRIISQSLNAGLTQNTLTFTTAPSRLYRLDLTADLAQPWSDSGLAVFAADVGPTTTRTVAFPTAPAQFFRAIALRPLDF